MPNAKRLHCTVSEHRWLTPTVLGIRLTANKAIHFEAGQFAAIEIPGGSRFWKSIDQKRLYSFASAPGGLSSAKEFELCVKLKSGGLGSEYLAKLKAGDTVNAWVPYGDFVYETDPSRSACFIATGTGIAPMRSIVLSKKFQENFPKQATLLFGAPDQSEILYPGEFERAGCQVVYALSNSKTLTNLWGKKLFDGRVTQYLERLPKTWNWHGTDFYLCGNGNMIDDVTAILTQSFGVNPSAIHAESFGVNSTPKELPVPEILRIAA